MGDQDVAGWAEATVGANLITALGGVCLLVLILKEVPPYSQPQEVDRGETPIE
jgi:hypothetical protein